jgi:hypothetical protein
MKPFYKGLCRFALASVIAVPMLALSPPSKANVTITPTIVVMEGRTRYADVNLINVTAAPHTYAIGWRFMKMVGDEGAYETVDKSLTDFDLTQNIAFTPKRVTIEPNGLQKIRLGLRLKGEPPAPGDYRGHIELRDIGQTDTAADKNAPVKAPPDQKAATVAVKINVGFSIPVVYRVGESTAIPVFGTITTALDAHGRPEIIIPVTKAGGPTYGILGRLQIYYNDKLVGEIKNANIFPEVPHRTFKIPLNIMKLTGGNVHIIYKHYDLANETVYAEKTVPVGQ